jgi:predicted glycoside hydrolase/deacetylase ChbG (UPF0249 family)
MKITHLFAFLVGVFLAPLSNPVGAQEIRLLVRGDDIGSSHAVNLACIKSYKEGIMQSVELMVPTPWFPEAVKLLNENLGLDVGLHLTLTSEWENVKWRPVSCVPSLVDADGYFFPMVWQNPNFPPNSSIQKSNWKIEEVEKEMRAQIEVAMRHVPRISHIGCHMECSSLNPAIAAVEKKLAREFNLDVDLSGVKFMRGWGKTRDFSEREKQFIHNLEVLKPGTYLFIDHPGLNDPEMQAIGHKGYEDVALDREGVTRVFTSAAVKTAILSKGIKLISYKDLKKGK